MGGGEVPEAPAVRLDGNAREVKRRRPSSAAGLAKEAAAELVDDDAPSEDVANVVEQNGGDATVEQNGEDETAEEASPGARSPSSVHVIDLTERGGSPSNAAGSSTSRLWRAA